MKDGARAIEVTILDRTLKIACREDEKADLLRAVEVLDAKMREIRGQSKVLSVERVAIMAALNIAHEFMSNKPNGSSSSSIDGAAIRRRIVAMQETLDSALAADQEKLF